MGKSFVEDFSGYSDEQLKAVDIKDLEAADVKALTAELQRRFPVKDKWFESWSDRGYDNI